MTASWIGPHLVTDGAAHTLIAGKYTLDRASATAGNAVHSYTIPAGFPLRLLFGHVVLTTDATVADRRVVISLYDESDALVCDIHAGATTPASQVGQHIELMQGVYREATFVAGTLQLPIPLDWVALPGYSIKISIEGGVAGDSYTATMMFAQA